MERNKGKFFTSVSLGTAAVWFSTHCGAGFASGTQELQYFSNHGWFGPLMPLLSILIIAITYYFCIEIARLTDKWSYDAWSKEAFDPLSKFCSIAVEISIVITTVAASAAAIAAGAALANTTFGMPIWMGSILMFLIITLLCIFGEKVVRNNAIIMTIAILAIISFILVVGLFKFWPNIVNLFSEGYVNPNASKWSVSGSGGTTEGSFFNSLLWALTYSGFQFGAIGGVAASFKGATSSKESVAAMGIGYVINTIMLAGICLLIFSGMPEIYNDEQARLLPTVFMVNQLDLPFLSVIYPLLLFLALITTAVGLTFGMVQRLDPYVLRNVKNPLVRKAAISIICLGICYAVSTLGLMWVIQVAYKYLGIFNWIFLIIPLWILGGKNIKRRRNAQKSN
ncbi:MAG: hypothetical protein RR495_07445 [Anaerovoracaceae bacterium]